MAGVEFSEEIRDRILYHWSELGDRPRVIWTRLQEEGFNVDLNTVEALMQCEQSDEEAGGTLAEQCDEDSRNGGGSVSSLPDGGAALAPESPSSVRGNVKRGKAREPQKVSIPQNRRTKLTPDVLTLIEKILDTDGNIYSLAALQAALLTKGVKISKTTTFRALEKLGRSIVVKKMSYANRVDVPINLRNDPHFASRLALGHRDNKHRQRALTIREIESVGPHIHHHHSKADHRGAVSTSVTASTRAGASSSNGQPRGFAVGPRMEGEGPVADQAPTTSLVLPPKKAVTAASLNLVLGKGGVTSYTSAPLDNDAGNDDRRGKDENKEGEEAMEQESSVKEPSATKSAPKVKKEVVDDDYELKVDDDYELKVDEPIDDQISTGRRSVDRHSDKEATVSRHADQRRQNGIPGRISRTTPGWMARTHDDDDDEAAILEARSISRHRLSHPGDQVMMGSDDDLDTDPEDSPSAKRPESRERSSVGSAQSAASHGSHSSHGAHSSHDGVAKSGRSSSTLTSHSGSSSGSGMDRCRRSPGISPAAAATLPAAGMRHPSFPLTFHRAQMCNAAAMASRLAAAHGFPPDMGQSVHVGQRRLPLSAGRGGVKQPFMSKYQRNLIGARQAMAPGMPRRMQRMAAAAGLPNGIPPHKLHKMMRMHHAMGKAMRGMHHFGGPGGRFLGEFPGRHMRNRQFAAAHAASHGPSHFSADDVSPELEIDPPETYGEFAERIFSSNRNQRQAEPASENGEISKWMGDISHRLEVIESQLNLVLEHLPFLGGAELQSVSSDAGGAGSEVDSGLQEDHVGGPGGSHDGRGGGGGSSGGGADGSGQGEGAVGERPDGGDTGGDERKEGGDRTGGGEGETEERGSGGEGRSGRTAWAVGKRSTGVKERLGKGREEGRGLRETPMEEGKGSKDGVDCVMLDEWTEGGRLSDRLNDQPVQSRLNQPQTKARIDMVMHDPRWLEMTPYAGAPRLAIALARYCIFGTKVLIKSSVTGRNRKNPLDFSGMRKIKHLLHQLYGARCSPIEFEVIWKTSRESISQLCKRLRRKYNAASCTGQPLQEDFMIDCPLLT